MNWKQGIARLLAPEEFAAIEKRKTEIDLLVSQRVAEVLLKMDPFEPLLKKYNVIFSKEWDHPEDRLDEQSKIRLFAWGFGALKDPSFKHITDWIQNSQGNATLRKGKQNDEWFFGRASLAVMTLFIREVGRLASRYEEYLSARDNSFDEHLPVGEI